MGGPPVRGDLLTYWETDERWSPDDASARRWLSVAGRIATGIAEIAHLTATVEPALRLLAVGTGPDATDARALRDAILAERVEAVLVVGAGHEHGVALPCGPAFTDEEITHVVLACMKATHAVDAPD